MDGFWFHMSKTRTFCSPSALVSAQKCPSHAQPVVLWRTGLLLSFLSLTACLDVWEEQDCVLGIVGRPVLLPCFKPELLKFENLSIEWRKNDEVVLRSVWQSNEHEEMWGFSVATLADAVAASTGNFSLKLLEADPQKDNATYSLFIISERNQRAPLCTVCLRIAARFSSPQLQRKEGEEGNNTAFLCQSSGGYPKPTVSWIINDKEEPPEGAVTTLAMMLDSLLYNISSSLVVNISKDASVSCIIRNSFMNETLVSTSYGVSGGPIRSRASQAMWMFSTGLCVVVGVMVIAGLAYQIHLDRISKKKKKEFQATQKGCKRRRPQYSKEETEVMKSGVSKETDV